MSEIDLTLRILGGVLDIPSTIDDPAMLNTLGVWRQEVINLINQSEEKQRTLEAMNKELQSQMKATSEHTQRNLINADAQIKSLQAEATKVPGNTFR